MLRTGTTCLLLTVGLLLISNSCSLASSDRHSTSTVRFPTFRTIRPRPWPIVICPKGHFSVLFLCKACPASCVTCRNSTYCTECIDERWGPACDRKCTNCVMRKCSIHTGSCLHGCENGFYALSNPARCERCPSNCENCSASGCDKCKPGFTGEHCEKVCPPNCQSCSLSNCSSCNPGFVGRYCEIECALCKKGHCSSDGCIEGCIDGYFSSNFTKVCNKCQPNCASCTSWQNCTSCVSGFHGKSCEYNCNRFCRNTTCDQTTGECIHGCMDRFYEIRRQCIRCPKCTFCSTVSCQSSCCEVTKNPVCQVPYCKNCSVNDSRFCEECLRGSYITNNGSCKLCSTTCKYKTCYPHNGTCNSGCIDGWKGTRCTEDQCTEKGYYRDRNKCLSCPPCASCHTPACMSSCCEGTTPSMCNVENCETCTANNPNVCMECSNGSYVTDKGICETCSKYCINRKCKPHDGTCLLGCFDGWTGSHCTESVCANSSCVTGLQGTNQDESGQTSVFIGAGIGSAILVLIVVVLITLTLVRRNKSVQKKSSSPVETETKATNDVIYHNVTSNSNDISISETTNQNTEMQILPENSEYADVDDINTTINTYETLGKRDDHLYAKSSCEALESRDDHLYSQSSYEALGSRDEHLYSKDFYDELGARDEHAYHGYGESIYVNKQGVQ